MKRSQNAKHRSWASSEGLTTPSCQRQWPSSHSFCSRKDRKERKEKQITKHSKNNIGCASTPGRQRSYDLKEDYTKINLLHSGFHPAKEATADWYPPVCLKINRCFKYREMQRVQCSVLKRIATLNHRWSHNSRSSNQLRIADRFLTDVFF